MRKFTLSMLVLIVSAFFTTTSACEDFDALTPGGNVAGQLGGYWTTWTGSPGGADDPFITDANSNSPSNSFAIDDAAYDLIYQFGDEAISTGQWMYSHYMYVATGVTGYFNVQADPEAGVDWNLEIFFQDGGTGYFAGQSTDVFTYTQDAWFMVEIMYDLDAGMGYVYIDGTMILEFANTLTIGGIDYWGWADEGAPGALYDDVCFDAVSASAGFCDNFDSYTAGDFLCTQSEHWTTWDNNPGGDYDAYVSDAMAQTAPNAMSIDLAVIESDVLTDLGQTTEGTWSVSLDLYVPDDGLSGGYFNVMQDMELFGAANEWGFQVYFRSDNTGYMQDADFTQTDFTYNTGEWTHCEVMVDLDMAMAYFYVNGSMVNEWQWDIAGPNMLGAVDIYAAADGNDDPMMYIDNFCFEEVPESTACENFDSYAAGAFVAESVPGWTTWSGSPGSAEDALITDEVSNSPSNSFVVEGTTDLLQLFDEANITSGKYHYSNMMYIPTGFTGYFNLQKDIVPGTEWGFQVMFDSDGTATVDAGAAAALVFQVTFDEWHMNEVVVDIDADIAEYWYDGELMIAWAWSLGTFGDPGAMTLGGANYYANAGITGPKAFFDDVCFEEYEVPANCDYFDDLTAGDFLCTQSDNWTTWDDNPGGDYDAYITDEMSETAPNSISIDAAVIESDIVYDLGQKVAGAWAIELDFYVPDGGFGGYYNVMQDMELFGAANEWGFQVYFRSDGTGYMQDADFTQFDFEYNVGEWNHSAVYVDLDADVAQYVINETIVATWQWAVAGPLMLGAVDIYAAADGNDDPKMYIDNFCYDATDIHVGIVDPVAKEAISANIYPNPARDQITIESNNIIDEVRIYNNMGQLVYSGEFDNDQIMVNTSNFITGMYVVQVRSGDAVEVRKLIIE